MAAQGGRGDDPRHEIQRRQREPGKVLNYTTFAIVLATIADTTALYVLRVREPNRARPYRAAGYPVVPLVYIVAHLAIAVSMAIGKPIECLTSVGVLLAGAPIYLLFARGRR